MKLIKGLPAAAGLAIGPVFQIKAQPVRVDESPALDPAGEWGRLLAALEVARMQLGDIAAKVREEVGSNEAGVFEAQSLMLADPDLLASIREKIENQRENAIAALTESAGGYVRALESLGDAYFRERAADVADVVQRVTSILRGERMDPAYGLAAPSIVVGDDLTPSQTVMLDKSLVLALCTARGGMLSHTAILARSLGLPAVVGCGATILECKPGTNLALDGGTGEVWIDPDAEIVAGLEAKRRLADEKRRIVHSLRHEPSVTRDGKGVEVLANIGNVEDARVAMDAGAEGVGLLRTEFLYLGTERPPAEEDQVAAYRAIIDVFRGLPVVLRTLDIGGDKGLPYLDLAPEANPFLGVRGIRLCLARPDIFRPQLRAALRVAENGNLRIMFPMVATLGEVRTARRVLQQCAAELRSEGHSIAAGINVGIMIETPAAAMIADQLAGEVDFFSIGTNDLSQYALAADRTNPATGELASAFQPSVLRLIARVVEAAHSRGKRVAVCGELGGEPLAIPILIGLGVDELSMNAPAIPSAKQILRSLELADMREAAVRALEAESPDDVQALVRQRFPIIV